MLGIIGLCALDCSYSGLILLRVHQILGMATVIETLLFYFLYFSFSNGSAQSRKVLKIGPFCFFFFFKYGSG